MGAEGIAGNVFISSPGHSGSTLLTMVLGSHSRAVAAGELTYLPRNLALNEACSCGSPIRACAFWQQVIERLSERLGRDLRAPYALELGYMTDRRKLSAGYNNAWKLRHGLVYLSLRSGVPLPAPLRRRFDAGVANTAALYDAIRAVSGARLVVDSSKSYLKALGLYRLSPADTRVILLMRDGRASYYSRLKRGASREASMHMWKDYYLRALPLFERYVDERHLIRVKYEDLVADPAGTVRGVCERLGLAFEPEMLEFRARVHHVANGNRMRSRGDGQIRADAAWQRQLSPQDALFFERHAGDVNRRLGY